MFSELILCREIENSFPNRLTLVRAFFKLQSFATSQIS